MALKIETKLVKASEIQKEDIILHVQGNDASLTGRVTSDVSSYNSKVHFTVQGVFSGLSGISEQRPNAQFIVLRAVESFENED